MPSRKNRKHNNRRLHMPEMLERRRLLAGNAIIQSIGGIPTLVVTGTTDSEQIFVNVNSSAQVAVTIISKTTGAQSVFKPFNGLFTNISIDAGAGNDLLSISNNVTYTKSTMLGGGGSDNIQGGLGADLMSGGDGLDTADYSSRLTGIKVTNDDATANDGTQTPLEGDNVQCEEVIGGAGNDNFVGGTQSDYYDGQTANDTFNAGDGNNTMVGGYGNDNLVSGSGNDSMYTTDSTTDTLTAGAGTDAAYADGFDVQRSPVGVPLGPVAVGAGALAASSSDPKIQLDPSFNGLGQA